MNIPEQVVLEQLDSCFDPHAYQYFTNLLNKRTIIYNEDIGTNTLEELAMPLLAFEQDDSQEPVTLYFQSVGGSVDDGLWICDIIDNYSKPLNIIFCGYCYSMGALIMCAGYGNPNVHKSCYKFTNALFHNGNTQISGETMSVREAVDFSHKIDDRIKDYVTSHSAISVDTYEKNERKQWYLTSEELLQYNIVDEIIGKKSSK